MRVLIDECVDPRVRLLLDNHKVATVHEQGWDALEDGPLLIAAQREFDILLTIDKGLQFQQNLAKFQIALIVVHVEKNQIAHYRSIQEEMLAAIEKIRSGEVIHVRSAAKGSR